MIISRIVYIRLRAMLLKMFSKKSDVEKHLNTLKNAMLPVIMKLILILIWTIMRKFQMKLTIRVILTMFVNFIL